MDNRLIRDRDNAEKKSFKAQFDDLKHFRRAFRTVWEKEYQESLDKTEKREVFDSPNALAAMAYELGYRAAKKECIKLLSDSK